MSEPTPDAPQNGARAVGPRSLKGSAEARRHAVMILEALNGVRTTQEAADAMGIALPRYYVLETRALEGFIEALEPRRRGRRVSVDREQEKLREELARQEKEARRYQALYRATQRALGVPASASGGKPSSKKATTGKAKTTKTRRRRQKTRAEAVLEALRRDDTVVTETAEGREGANG